MKIGNYFEDYEFACKCHRHNVVDGKNVLDHVIDKRLVDVLDKIRERVGRPVYIESGYRCEDHNREVGGVPNSQHVLGTAADITVDDISIDELADIAKECGADGVGRYYGLQFVHIDVRGYDAKWEQY